MLLEIFASCKIFLIFHMKKAPGRFCLEYEFTCAHVHVCAYFIFFLSNQTHGIGEMMQNKELTIHPFNGTKLKTDVLCYELII